MKLTCCWVNACIASTTASRTNIPCGAWHNTISRAGTSPNPNTTLFQYGSTRESGAGFHSYTALGTNFSPTIHVRAAVIANAGVVFDQQGFRIPACIRIDAAIYSNTWIQRQLRARPWTVTTSISYKTLVTKIEACIRCIARSLSNYSDIRFGSTGRCLWARFESRTWILINCGCASNISTSFFGIAARCFNCCVAW